MGKGLCVQLKYYDKYEYSFAVMEKLTEVLDEFFENNTVMCPHCGRVFLETENALQYEMPDGDYACECMSPENQASAMADMWIDEQKDNK